MNEDKIAKAIRDAFISPNVLDSSLEPANIVDVTNRAAQALKAVADGLVEVAAAIQETKRS